MEMNQVDQQDERSGVAGKRSKVVPWSLVLCAASLVAFALLFSSSATYSRPHLRKLQAFWIKPTKTSWNQPSEFSSLEDASRLPGGISKIIHQSWKSDQLPEKFIDWSQSWKTNHPDWEYVLWTDESNRRLVAEHFPYLLPVYDGLPEAIMRADTARVLYMKQFGGCYADLDFESLKPLDPLLEGLPIALAQMGVRTADTKAEVLQNSIPNAFMCSTPQHPFWDFALRHIVEKAAHDAAVGDSNWDHVEQTAGPGMIYAANEEYILATGASVPLLSPGSIYPYDWTLTWTGDSPVVEACHAPGDTFNAEKCKAFFPDAYAITYWTHSWGSS